jgi:NTE family protein
VAGEGRYRNHCDLVCEGGGVKGIGLAGAYSVLEEQGFHPQNVAGTSAGAITAALIAAGYSAAELKEVIFGMEFLRFKDVDWEDRIPLVGKGVSIVKDLGIYEGVYFEAWIGKLLEAKGVKTFADLVTDEYGDDPQYRSRLQVIASDVTSHRLLVLPRDAGALGIEPDELEVAHAVRMSMSIPIFFEPVSITNETTKREHVIVDGGMLSNFPVWLFDCPADEEPSWPTFGLLLVEPDPKTPIGARLPTPERTPRGLGGLFKYVKSMADTMMEAHDRLYVEKANFARTIPIPTLGVGTTEFEISVGRKEALYQSGRAAATGFLETWDFDGYIEEFRKGKTHHRRLEVGEQMQQAAEREELGSPARPG